ncbi:MAG: DNA translocase FtsK 4TM domain-containing protein [Chloroflexota bacterium]|nr:DNA translocase FtsK 4TM domain-containing protein [Chloroflexota bacterium]
MTKRRSSRNSSRRTSRRRSSRRKSSKRRSLPSINLTLDQQLDILGYALLAVAAFTLLSFPSTNHGVIPGWWLGLLRRGFGWGAYFVPLFVGAVGLWLILRDFGDRLPRVTPQQVVGTLLGYLALLITFHLSAVLVMFDGSLVATAEAGHGGGAIGAALSQLLLEGLGTVGAVVVLITWWLIVIALVFGVTVQDGARALERLRGQGQPRRPRPLPPPTINTPATRVSEQPHPPLYEPPVAPEPVTVAPAQPLLIGSDQAWQLPKLDAILEPGNGQDFSTGILRQQARIIEETLESLGAPVWVRETNPGPVVTQFGIEPRVTTNSNGLETKVKVSRIKALADDLALALEAKTLRVEAPIPGKGLIGIEVPNPDISLVALRDVMESEQFAAGDSPLRLCLGQDVSGHPAVTDLTAMPHLLIAGTTGSGKSVCINAIIAALLLQNTPADLKLLMVDPKRVELTGYEGIPHLLSKVVVEMERVTSALQWVLREMDGRYRRFSEVRATHIRDYNERIAPSLGEKLLPYIVVVIDELADLMIMAPQETERIICRIAQMARATGIHLVIATQRPSVDVVTGLIKANFPARIAFNVASSVDSRVILDMPGAEQLLGQGDMLFLPPDAPMPSRLQGAFVSDEELRRLVHYWKEQGRPEVMPAKESVQQPLWEEMREKKRVAEFEDELLPDVIDLVLREQRASISLLQRKLRIGYTRASRIMDILEQHQVVGPQPTGGKAREVFPSAARALLNNPQGDG